MKTTNILFLAPNWRVSLIKAFQAVKGGGQIFGADSDPNSPTLEVVDLAHMIPRFSEPDCFDQFAEIIREQPVHAVIPLTNKAIDFLHAYQEQFDYRKLVPYAQDVSTLTVCHDKWNLAEYCKAVGIESPRTALAEISDSLSCFPLIAKPRQGEGGHNVVLIENRDDLQYYAAKLKDYVFQERIEGREFSIDWFSDKDGVPVLIVPRERLVVRGGEVMVSRILMDEAIIESARIAGLILGLRGPCTLQGILDETGRFVFTDINLRFGSGSVHTCNAGGNVPAMIYKDLAGEKPEFDPESIIDGSIMTRYPASVYHH